MTKEVLWMIFHHSCFHFLMLLFSDKEKDEICMYICFSLFLKRITCWVEHGLK